MEKYKWVVEILFGAGGLGTIVFRYIFSKKRKHQKLNQKQNSGENSINLQAGRDIQINDGNLNAGK